MELSDLFNNDVYKSSLGASYDDLDSFKVPSGYCLEVFRVAVENRTSAYTRLQIGVGYTVNFYPCEEQDSPAANDIYWTQGRFIVPQGRTLKARLTGCTSGDELHLIYQGRLWKLKE